MVEPEEFVEEVRQREGARQTAGACLSGDTVCQVTLTELGCVFVR